MLLACMAVPAHAQTDPGPAHAQTDPGYILGPEDQIDIFVYGQPELTVKTRVKSDGAVTLPVIGSMRASGQTVQGLADGIATRLRSGGVVKQPVVNVEVAAYVSRSVTVLGALSVPGIYPLDRPQTLSSMLARAGGVRSDGSDRVTLRRAGEADIRSLEIASLASDPKADVQLKPGDVLFVPQAEQFFIYGQVGAPGAYAISSRMTLRQALARGGGPTLAGTERRITLYRQGQRPAEADLEAAVRKGDVLFVRERIF
ncbi:polysaccharide biosynthesis/export family protein [Sphingomonas oleivorans]|uniref:polysaccharide biosynthesis/export family protein n=1 Tax=Sphingomonas oleivorans TaxID=1735121 RepID=UPI001FB04633|nr:polysaccharide biosynthesis/export family protein [Sphingomonas oleivorans]